MEKLEREFLENGGEWKEVCVDELFNKKTMKGFPKYEENLSAKDEGFHIFGQNIRYQYPQKVILNNKYLHKIDKDKPILAYTSSSCEIGIIEESFYRSGDNGAFQGLFPKFKNYNKKHLLFILSMLKKHFNTFDYSTSMADFMKLELELPFLNGKINFSYMEKFIEFLEAERIEELEAYLVATGLKNYKLTEEDQKILDDFEKMSDNSSDRQTDKIRLEDLMTWQVGISEIDPLKLNELYDKTSGKYPFYGQATDNNGIISYESLNAEILNNKNALPTILVHSNNQNVVYLQTPFYLKDGHGATSVLQNENMNLDIALYIMSCIRKSITERFDYNAKATKIGLKNTEVEIPFYNKVVDYKFMDEFIKVVKKLIIKDVVIWADKKIEATKQVVFKH
ncbi:restriction endonuclease subunit S [Megasphaera hutchinsoni]|uniref:restriction endonuclease subunit S n=1 Tax=Megasphaera hutchinsoni TaxID=1588748 RepID=UPI001C642720|nr:restriction endonuclease subunit S [Megasphaera genomosp. type_2]